MPEMTRYEHGVPSWVDLTTPNRDAAVAFYGELFDWKGEDTGPDSGHYVMMSKQGRPVAGISQAQDPGPPRWTTYVNVEGIDDVARRAGGAGGAVIFGPMDVMDEGRMAIFQDPTGAFIAAWQPGKHPGAGLVNEPGTLVWNELSTSDLAKARAFYSEIFGWSWGGGEDYAEIQVGGRTVGGVMPRPAGMPAEVPDNWLVYFGSSDLDADLAHAERLGATVVVAATEIPNMGRFAVLQDPQGAVFALYQG